MIQHHAFRVFPGRPRQFFAYPGTQISFQQLRCCTHSAVAGVISPGDDVAAIYRSSIMAVREVRGIALSLASAQALGATFAVPTPPKAGAKSGCYHISSTSPFPARLLTLASQPVNHPRIAYSKAAEALIYLRSRDCLIWMAKKMLAYSRYIKHLAGRSDTTGTNDRCCGAPAVSLGYYAALCFQPSTQATRRRHQSE